MVFDAFFFGVREVGEEVDAGGRLKLVDAHGVLLHDAFSHGVFVGVVVVFVFHEESDGGIDAVFDAEQCHEVVFRYGYLRPVASVDVCENLSVSDGASLDDVERVAEAFVSSEILNQSLQRHPVALVEVGILW